jgi:hypothetical protein
VSSHVATDADGTSGVYVNSKLKAWHCALFNSRTLGIEQVGFAEQGHWPTAQLLETARWIARWSRMYNIPIQLGSCSRVPTSPSGVSSPTRCWAPPGAVTSIPGRHIR